MSSTSPSPTGTDRAGGVTVIYRAPDDQPIRPTPEARAEVLRRILVTLEAYRAHYGWEPAWVECNVYPALTYGLPCGGGTSVSGCAAAGGPLYVGGDIRALFHELHHLHRHALGDPEWTQHGAEHWAEVWRWNPSW